MQQIPLYSHATCRREEVLATLGYFALGGKTSHREGVAWCEEMKTDAFFVTLEKDEKERAGSIMYKEYAMSPDVFHWESQNATSPESVTGRRYINHKSLGSKTVVFTRPRQRDENGMTMPYTCLGQLDYVAFRVEAGRQLVEAAPGDAADVYMEASVVAQ